MSSFIKKAVRKRIINLATTRYRLHPPISDLSHPLSLMAPLGMKCRGVIHVGANTGQEFEDYKRAELESVVYIEPIPNVFEMLKKHVSSDPRHHPIQALCADRNGEEFEFNVASNTGQSSSIFALGSHAERYPHIKYERTIKLRSRTLDDVIFNTPRIRADILDCLVMDVQGAELKVILGAHRTLSQCRYVFTEINEGGLYEGDSSYDEVLAMLKPYGFVLRSFDINEDGWGNAFLVKR
jgi:FkbM family methyltransferase